MALVSTGSTAGRIADAGVPVTKVEDLTGSAEVTVFPLASWMATRTAGVIGLPALVVTGTCAKASFVASPAAAVAVNGTDGTPEKTAFIRLEPAFGPSVQRVQANPLGLVVAVSGLGDPPPVPTTQLIALPPTPISS